MSGRTKRALTGVLAACIGFVSMPVQAAETEEPVPVLKAVCTEAYPGTDVTMTLLCENNPGFAALGVTLQLPDVLTPVTDQNQVQYTPGAALGAGNVYSLYNAETGALSFAYAAMENGPAEEEIAVFTLHVAEDADPETAYTVAVVPDAMTGIDGVRLEPAAEEGTFTPLAWPDFEISDPELLLIAGGEPHQLTVSPELPDGGSFKWSSDNFETAAVMPSGTVYGLKPGNAVITAQHGPISLTCQVTVHALLNLNITDYAAKKKGETFELKALDLDTDTKPEFSSSDPKKVSVTEDGQVKVLAKGEADIIVTADGKTGICHVTYRSYVRGDADLNGSVSAADAQAVLLEFLETTVLDLPSGMQAQQRLAGDADLDGVITLRDAMMILAYYADLINGLEPDWDAIAADMDTPATGD